MSLRLRIGTRGSPLARAQTALAVGALGRAHPDLAEPGALEVVAIRTTGDRVTDRPLAELGGKGLFCKELEAALLERRIDLAVHSIKDLPTWLPEGLVIGAVLARADPRDVLISRNGAGLDRLPPAAVVGTASLRRQAQLLARRPDLRVVNFRGNVETRLRKLAAGAVDATLLALAGLERLGIEPPGATVLAPEVMLPAVGQGAIGDRVPGGRRADARPARRDRRSGQQHLHRCRANAPGRAGWLLPHADRRPCHGRRRTAAAGGAGRAPGRQRLPAHDPRRSACGWRGARARCRPGAEGARRARLLRLRSGSIVGEFVRCAS